MKDTRRKVGEAASGGGEGALGDLLGTLGAALSEMIARLDHGGAGEVRRDIRFETEKGPVRAEAGVRVRVGGLDLPRAGGSAPRDPARPISPASATPHPAPVRPIHADVVDDGLVWRLTADLPGVAREDLALAVEDGMLSVSAMARGRQYADRFDLPPGASREALRVSLQNGILEIETPSAGADAE